METLSALLAFCGGNPPVSGGFLSQRPRTLELPCGEHTVELSVHVIWDAMTLFWRACNRLWLVGGTTTPYPSMLQFFCSVILRYFYSSALRFALNTKIVTQRDYAPGWMHVLDLEPSGFLGCNMPSEGTPGPLLHYSKLDTRSLLLTDPLGKQVPTDKIKGKFDKNKQKIKHSSYVSYIKQEKRDYWLNQEILTVRPMSRGCIVAAFNLSSQDTLNEAYSGQDLDNRDI